MEHFIDNPSAINALAERARLYAMPAPSTFVLCSESLAPFFARWTATAVGGGDVVESLSRAGFPPLMRDGNEWTDDGRPAWFRLRFVRDNATRGLFDPMDLALCPCSLLRLIVSNATGNPDRRMRRFCRAIALSKELCHHDLADDDVTEHLAWLARHTAAPKSVFAAAMLYYIFGGNADATANVISPEQMQFIRENPKLRPVPTTCS